MAIGYSNKGQAAVSSSNPIDLTNVNLASDVKALVVLINNQTTTARTGGSPTYNSVALTKAGSAQAGSSAFGLAISRHFLGSVVPTTVFE